MKFELKTQNDDDNSKSFRYFLFILFFILLTVILCDMALKLRNISRYYQITNMCRLLVVEKSSNNFKKLSRLSNLKSKQNVWEFCREVLN